MSTTSQAITILTQAVVELARHQVRVGAALVDIAREQEISNLLLRSQITTDTDEKDRLVAEASRLANARHWRAAPDPRWDTSRPAAPVHRP